MQEPVNTSTCILYNFFRIPISFWHIAHITFQEGHCLLYIHITIMSNITYSSASAFRPPSDAG